MGRKFFLELPKGILERFGGSRRFFWSSSKVCLVIGTGYQPPSFIWFHITHPVHKRMLLRIDLHILKKEDLTQFWNSTDLKFTLLISSLSTAFSHQHLIPSQHDDDDCIGLWAMSSSHLHCSILARKNCAKLMMITWQWWWWNLSFGFVRLSLNSIGQFQMFVTSTTAIGKTLHCIFCSGAIQLSFIFVLVQYKTVFHWRCGLLTAG